MRLPLRCNLMFFLAVVSCPGLACAQATTVSPEHHPWGSFKPGAWKLVRVLTETLDENGLVQGTSSTETRTTLLSVDKDGVTLEVEVVVEVAGKRIESDAEIIRQGFHGEMVCDDMKVGKPKDAPVTIEGRAIPCKVFRLECPGPTSKTVTDVFYSPEVAPYVLKRTSTTNDGTGNGVVNSGTYEVVTLNMPCKVMAEIMTSADVREVRKYPKGTITTQAITSTAVPGGIVSQRSKEVDNQGRVVRRSVLELVGYGLVSEEERSGVLRSMRRNLLRTKPSSRYRSW